MGAVDRLLARRSARAATVAAAAVLVLSLTGCGQRAEPTGATIAVYPVTVTQADGSRFALQHHPANVVADDPQAASLLSSLLGRRVQPTRKLEDAGLVVSTPESLAPRSPATYVAPDQSLDDVERALTGLGLLLDRPLRARQLVRRLKDKRTLVADRLAGKQPATVFVDTGYYTTVSSTSLLGRLIAEAGGRDVAGAKPQAGPFSLRKLLRLDPDYYLATSDSGTRLADLRRDPHARRLRAIRRRNFAVISSDAVLPGAQLGSTLAKLARILHPDAFR